MLIGVTYACSAGGAASHQDEAHIVTCSAESAQEFTSSSLTLSGLEAVEVQLWCLEVVHCWGLGDGAIGEPFAVLLLALWAPCCARGISVKVVASDLVDAMQVHAALLEQVLTPWLVAGVLVV